MKAKQEEEKKQLCSLRDQLKAALQLESKEVKAMDGEWERAGQQKCQPEALEVPDEKTWSSLGGARRGPVGARLFNTIPALYVKHSGMKKTWIYSHSGEADA